MSTDVLHAGVLQSMKKLHLVNVAQRLAAVLADAARSEPTYLDSLVRVLTEEFGSKQRKRIPSSRLTARGDRPMPISIRCQVLKIVCDRAGVREARQARSRANLDAADIRDELF
jgi:hypothetical protein